MLSKIFYTALALVGAIFITQSVGTINGAFLIGAPLLIVAVIGLTKESNHG